ncbi:MAG: HEAT repeat domain-containing protein [Bryobacteraceae bacterium]
MEHFVFELPPQYVAPARRSSDTVEDSIVRIFAAHIAALPKSRSFMGYPQSALIAFARDSRGKPGAALQEAIGEFLSSPKQDLQMLALQLKIALNDLAAPALVDSAPQMLDQGRSSVVVGDFRAWYRSEDVLSVRAVVRILNTTKNESLKEACVWTLHRAHIRASLPTLAAALDSPNARIRYLAVSGLAAFAKNMTYDMTTNNPGPWRYRTEETEKRSRGTDEQLAGVDSVQFWRSWWENYKKELAEE